MAVKLLFYNSKGGVGKTTSVWGLASGLAEAKQKTLVVDLDFQGHQARVFGLKKQNKIGQLLKGELNAEEAIVSARENLDLIPSDFELSDQWNNVSITQVEELLKSIERKYRFIIFDTNPGMNSLTKSAANYADYVLAPLYLEYLAVDGIVTLQKLMENVDKNFNKRLLGIIPCRHDLRGRRTLEVLDAVKQKYKDKISPPVRTNISIDKAQNLGQTLYEFDPNCNGAHDYFEVTKWVIESVRQRKKEKAN